jgi:hypothetical protein
MDPTKIQMGVGTTPQFDKNIKALMETSVGSDMFMSIVLLTVFGAITTYVMFLNHAKSQKATWQRDRCSPASILTASQVWSDLPDPGSFAEDNFASCTTEGLGDIVTETTAPLVAATTEMSERLAGTEEALGTTNSGFAAIAESVQQVFEAFRQYFNNMWLSVRELLIHSKDTIGKMNGVLMTGFYSVLSVYLAMKSTMGAVMSHAMKIMIGMISTVFVSWLFIPTWPIAIATTISFATLTTVMVVFSAFISDVLKLHGPGIPSLRKKPSFGFCFHPETIISTQYGDRSIKRLVRGDQLADGSVVNSVMELRYEPNTMYRDRDSGVWVTGTHRLDVHGTMVCVSDHPDFMAVEYTGDRVYCINTSSRRIAIGTRIFGDWDDVDTHMIHRLKGIDVDVGFDRNAIVRVQGKNGVAYSVRIKEVVVGDTIVRLDGTVRGIVDGIVRVGPDFHLITDSGMIDVDGKPYTDFSGMMEAVEMLVGRSAD